MVKSLDFILQLVGNHWIVLSKAFLLLERHKTYRVPLGNEFVQSFLVSFSSLRLVGLDFLNYSLLSSQVLLKLLSLVAKMLCLSCKELVAGGAEPLPDSIGLLAGNRAYGLPDILKVNQLVRSLLPVFAVFDFLCLSTQILFLAQILLHHILELGIEVTLSVVEFVAGGAESLVNLLVVFLGGKTNALPLELEILHLLAQRIPLVRLNCLSVCYLFSQLAELCLCFEIGFLPLFPHLFAMK